MRGGSSSPPQLSLSVLYHNHLSMVPSLFVFDASSKPSSLVPLVRFFSPLILFSTHRPQCRKTCCFFGAVLCFLLSHVAPARCLCRRPRQSISPHHYARLEVTPPSRLLRRLLIGEWILRFFTSTFPVPSPSAPCLANNLCVREEHPSLRSMPPRGVAWGGGCRGLRGGCLAEERCARGWGRVSSALRLRLALFLRSRAFSEQARFHS